MPELEDITYSRTATIAAISDYYHFLTTMYLKDSQVIYPPAEGWPSIINANPEMLQSLGKSDEVLALLAHLPYIHFSWAENDVDGAAGCIFANWGDIISNLTGPTGRFSAEDVRLLTEGPFFSQFVAPQAFSLTCGGRENSVMLLDTKRGIIHWEDCPDRVERSHYNDSVDFDESDDEMDKEEVVWREGAQAWAIPDFFEVLKDQFRELHWIPVLYKCGQENIKLSPFEHAANPPRDDGLWDNTCWPQQQAPDDPVYTIWEWDEWYERNMPQIRWDFKQMYQKGSNGS